MEKPVKVKYRVATGEYDPRTFEIEYSSGKLFDGAEAWYRVGRYWESRSNDPDFGYSHPEFTAESFKTGEEAVHRIEFLLKSYEKDLEAYEAWVAGTPARIAADLAAKQKAADDAAAWAEKNFVGKVFE